MKINQKIYNSITTQPFDVQDINEGVTVELHSLNENESLFEEYAKKQGKFAIWTCADGKNYRLLLEDSLYERMRDFYGKRVNRCWIEFWDIVEKQRGKIMKFVFIPVSIVVFLIFILVMFFGNLLGETGQMVAMGVSLVAFIIVNVIVNKKVESIVNTNHVALIEKIKNIVGHERFEELLDIQQSHYDDFFHVNEEVVDEVQGELVEPVENSTEDVNNSSEE